MEKRFTGRISRIAASLAIAGAIVGGMVAGIADTNSADAALKWREEVIKWTAKPDNIQDNNKDGLKHTDSTTTTTTP